MQCLKGGYCTCSFWLASDTVAWTAPVSEVALTARQALGGPKNALMATKHAAAQVL